jgi:hypothetical protein
MTGSTEPSLWTRAPVLPKPLDGCPRTRSHGYPGPWDLLLLFQLFEIVALLYPPCFKRKIKLVDGGLVSRHYKDGIHGGYTMAYIFPSPQIATKRCYCVYESVFKYIAVTCCFQNLTASVYALVFTLYIMIQQLQRVHFVLRTMLSLLH